MKNNQMNNCKMKRLKINKNSSIWQSKIRS